MHRPTITLPWTRSFTTLFALIIGIDSYQSKEFSGLKGAVRDAFSYKDYLTNCLGVPENHIYMLINQAASRDAILEAIMSFKNDARINVGDPIFIVYAGHGSQIEAPHGWETGGRHLVQALVPYDYCSIRGLEVPCIPDRTIGALLEAIAEEKGNNITVVLDCCYSASGTRAGTSKLRVRSVTLKPSNIDTEDLDRDIWDSGHKVIHPNQRFRYKGLRSHILLAACSSFERAGEIRGHGKFSRALLKLFRSTPPDKLRYSQILSSLDVITEQNPQVEGVELDRFLFGIPVEAPLPTPIYPLFLDDESGLHLINIGTAQGITQGSTFDLLPEMNAEAAPTGSFAVVRAMSFYSFLAPQNEDLKTFATNFSHLSVRRNAGGQKCQIRLYVTPNDRYQTSLRYLESLLGDKSYDLRNLIFVDDPGEAHLEISINRSNKATFQLLDKAVTQHGFHYRYPRVDARNDKMASFFDIISNYYSELCQTNDDDDASELMDDIEVSCFRLEETPSMFNDISQIDMVAVGQDLCQYNEIDLVVQDDSCYGFKIVNHSARDLYLTLSYFDSRDLGSIATLYSSSSSGPYKLEAPLKRFGGSLPIGYGSGGAAPVTFSLQEDQDIAVGFLKISVFTRPTNFIDSMQQFCIPGQDTWGSLIIPIIQRRRPKQTPISPFHRWLNPPEPVDRRISTHIHAMSRRTASMPNHLSARSQ